MIKIAFNPKTGGFYQEDSDGEYWAMVPSRAVPELPPGCQIQEYVVYGTYIRDAAVYVVDETGITRFADGQYVTEVPRA